MTIKNSAILAAFTFAFATLVAVPSYAAPTARPTPAAQTQGQPASETTDKTSKSAKLDSEASRYAERENESKKQQDYQGGDMLVIGISTGAAIVVLIIVLLLL